MGTLLATYDQPDQLPSYGLPLRNNPTRITSSCFFSGGVLPDGPTLVGCLWAAVMGCLRNASEPPQLIVAYETQPDLSVCETPKSYPN